GSSTLDTNNLGKSGRDEMRLSGNAPITKRRRGVMHIARICMRTAIILAAVYKE
ncbi:MAG: hypothetical protein K0S65_2517, partial [Labilithrix sp.]|nr:hypothetical protein [Labilithrix sp.]